MLFKLKIRLCINQIIYILDYVYLIMYHLKFGVLFSQIHNDHLEECLKLSKLQINKKNLKSVNKSIYYYKDSVH